MPRIQRTHELIAEEWKWAGGAFRQLRERWVGLKSEKKRLFTWVETEYSIDRIASRTKHYRENAAKLLDGQPMLPVGSAARTSRKKSPKPRASARDRGIARVAAMIGDLATAAGAAPDAAPTTAHGQPAAILEVWKSVLAAALVLDPMEDRWLHEIGDLFRLPWDSDRSPGRKDGLAAHQRAAFEMLQRACPTLGVTIEVEPIEPPRDRRGPGFVWPLWPSGVPRSEFPMRGEFGVTPGLAFNYAPQPHIINISGGMVVPPSHRVYVPTEEDLARLKQFFPDEAPENPDWVRVKKTLVNLGGTEESARGLSPPLLLAAIERRKQIDAAIDEQGLRKLVSQSSPLSEPDALRVLAAMKHWALDELPACIDQGLLTCLDSDDFVEVRHVVMQKFALKPEHPTVSRPTPTEWFSPIKQPERSGNWATIWSKRLRDVRNHPFEVRVSDRGHAELARNGTGTSAKLKHATTAFKVDPAAMRRPVLIADAARAVNIRSDLLKKKLLGRSYPIGGPKGAYVAEFDHLCAVAGPKRSQFVKWADQQYPTS